MAVCMKMKSDYSFLSSTLTIDDMISFCVANHLTTCSLIDNNMFGALQFYNACLSASLKPILGVELQVNYKENIYPINFIAKTERGYKNLVKLTSIANGFNKSSVDFKTLGLYSEDLIVVLSSEDSYLSFLLKENNIFEANEFVANLKYSFKEIFAGIYRYKGIEEVTLNNFKEYVNQANILSIAFQYVTHKSVKDTVILNLLNCIKKSIPANKEFLQIPSIVEAHLKTEEQLKIYYDRDELDNLNKLIDSINLKISKVNYSLPEITDNPDEKIKELSLVGLKQLGLYNNSDYVNRVNYELSIISKMGFSNYYLVVADYVNYAKSVNIPVGPARGSGAASLVAYLLKITTIDPIKYELLFERFLNPSRINYPDFDIDFADINRDDIIEYVKNKYGYKKVAHIATFSTFGPKSAIRDIARLLKISNDEVDNLTKSISSNCISINNEYKTNDKFRHLLEIHGNLKTVCSLASNIEGLKRQPGLHAAGIIISKDNLSDLVPTFEVAENTLAIQYDYVMAENIGLIKMDFLALKNLTIIDYCLKRINKEYGHNYTIDNFPYDDNSAYKQISSLDTIGIFQLESTGINNVIAKLQPSCFDDVVALLALYRPGPMDMIPAYIERKHGKPFEYIDEAIKPILEKTYGIIVYQEQIMQICQKVASYTLGDADILRRAISKKKLNVIKAEKDKFIKGCLANNFSQEKANKIFSYIEKFADYGFNKAHSVGYGKIATMMAYIKANYKTIFYEALLNVNQESGDRKKQLFLEAKKNNIKIISPCIKESNLSYKTTKDSIMFGLTNITSIKDNIASIIIKEREKAPFNDIVDFVIRMALNDVSLQILMDLNFSNALSCFGISKEKLSANLGNLYSNALLFAGFDYQPNTYKDPQYSSIDIPLMWFEDEETDFAKKEYEMLGIYISKHPLEKIKENLSKKYSQISMVKDDGFYNILGKIVYLETRKTKDNKDSLIIRIEDESGDIQLREYKTPLEFKNNFRKTQIVYVNLTMKNGYGYLNNMEKVEVK